MAKVTQSLFFIFFLLVLSVPVSGTELIFFYENGCPYSARIGDFLEKRIRPHYPVEIKAYEIHDPASANLMLELARAFGAKDILEKGTPAVFIGEKALQGENRLALRQIEEAVRVALRQKAASPFSRLEEEEEKGEKFRARITLPAVIGAAAVSALNPCAGAVLIILLGTILVASRRKMAVFGAGFSFTAASFISYFLVGLGLLTTVQGSGIQRYAYIVVSVLAVLIGLWNMKDFFWKRQLSIENLPEGWQPFIKRSTSRITPVLGASLVGFAASLFLLPCTSGPYIVIIGMLADSTTQMKGVWLLVLYNAIFVLPFIIITLAVGLGLTSASRVENWRLEKLRKLRLISGAVMFSLGVTLVVFLLLGII